MDNSRGSGWRWLGAVLPLLCVVGLAAPGMSQPTSNPTTNEPHGTDSVEAVARGILGAMAARDVEAAAQFLPDAALCEQMAPPHQLQTCLASIQQVLAELPEAMLDVPEGFVAGEVTVLPQEGPPGFSSVQVAPTDPAVGEPITLMVIEMGGRFYVGFAVAAPE